MTDNVLLCGKWLQYSTTISIVRSVFFVEMRAKENGFIARSSQCAPLNHSNFIGWQRILKKSFMKRKILNFKLLLMYVPYVPQPSFHKLVMKVVTFFQGIKTGGNKIKWPFMAFYYIVLCLPYILSNVCTSIVTKSSRVISHQTCFFDCNSSLTFIDRSSWNFSVPANFFFLLEHPSKQSCKTAN